VNERTEDNMISVICPFYNEEAIIGASVKLMLNNLATLRDDWELIIVNDGSTDRSLEIALNLEKEHPRLKVIGYGVNRGRGHAIRIGAAEAKGEIIVTTEIDSSWGDDIVHRIVEEFDRHPDADIVIASPHLLGGGYRNVPALRVFLSTIGNYVIRSGLTYSVTMNTGMTRGYKRKKFLAMPLNEDEKEMHLEIINKAIAFGYRIYEIPAILEWKDHKFTDPKGKKRKSSSNINKLIRTHVLFSLLAAPFRYLYFVSAMLGLVSVGFLMWAIINLFTPTPSIYVFLSSLLFGLFALLIFGIGVVAQQGRAQQREIWRLRSEIRSKSSIERG
jgi:glycosyltransferase involved in cell wall biosynthesis